MALLELNIRALRSAAINSAGEMLGCYFDYASFWGAVRILSKSVREWHLA